MHLQPFLEMAEEEIKPRHLALELKAATSLWQQLQQQQQAAGRHYQPRTANPQKDTSGQKKPSDQRLVRRDISGSADLVPSILAGETEKAKEKQKEKEDVILVPDSPPVVTEKEKEKEKETEKELETAPVDTGVLDSLILPKEKQKTKDKTKKPKKGVPPENPTNQ